MNRQSRAFWLILTVVIVVLDLWSKAAWEYPSSIEGGGPMLQHVVFESWIQIRTIWNTGGVWSSPINRDLLLWATILAIPLVAVWIFWPDRASRIDNAAKALILGGALGNLYDRMRFGAVRDFIDVYFGGLEGWHWPTFNIADMSLVCGITLLLLMGLKKPEPEATA